MPTHDIWHETVKKALIKDGWIITDDPLSIQFGGVDVYIDLAAEKLIAAEKEGKKIAIEVKSFLGDSTTYEFHTAVGQFTTIGLCLARANQIGYYILRYLRKFITLFLKPSLLG